MIDLGTEPHGLLLRAADVRAWLPGLTRHQWLRLRKRLGVVSIDGKPFYRREEVRAKIVRPLLPPAPPILPPASSLLMPNSTKSHR